MNKKLKINIDKANAVRISVKTIDKNIERAREIRLEQQEIKWQRSMYEYELNTRLTYYYDELFSIGFRSNLWVKRINGIKLMNLGLIVGDRYISIDFKENGISNSFNYKMYNYCQESLEELLKDTKDSISILEQQNLRSELPWYKKMFWRK